MQAKMHMIRPYTDKLNVAAVAAKVSAPPRLKNRFPKNKIKNINMQKPILKKNEYISKPENMKNNAIFIISAKGKKKIGICLFFTSSTDNINKIQVSVIKLEIINR